MMRKIGIISLLILSLAPTIYGKSRKTRIIVVSSYHREYLWSQETHEGLCSAFLEFGYLNDKSQIDEFTKSDYVESSRAIIKKLWMDTKRKSSKQDMAASAVQIVNEIKQFKPDAIMLGDDNASNYIGAQFLDTGIPILTWGMDVTPLKYGLMDSLEAPGHNVTGTYQSFFFQESLEFLKKIVPGIKTFAVLSDDSETGRAKMKRIQQLADAGKLPVKLAAAVATNSYSEWKAKALQLQDQVDAFFILNHSTIKGDAGEPVDQLRIGAWYLHHIKKPECAPEEQFVLEGMLSAAEDSGFKQGYGAVKALREVLSKGKNPATLPCRAPSRGPLIVNRERARMLGITLTKEMAIEKYAGKSLALEKYPGGDE